MLKKIKKFIHNHIFLEKIILYLWGIFCIIRASLIFRKIKHKNPNKNIKILVLAVRSLPTTSLVYFDGVFGHAFKKLGCTVKMLYSDGVIDSSDADTVLRNEIPQNFVSKKLGWAVKRAMGLDSDAISYKDNISEEEIKEIKNIVAKVNTKDIPNFHYLGINVGKHANAAAIRYFLFGKLNFDNAKEMAVLRKKLYYAMVAIKVASHVFEKEKPNTIFMLHGIYSTWGPFLSYFASKGVETVVYENRTSRNGYFTFFRNSEAFSMHGKQEWLDFEKKDLLKEEKEEVENYLDNRLKGNIGEHLMFKKNIDSAENKKYILNWLFKKEYKKRYIIYPNVFWDECIAGNISNIFDDGFDWIDKTIEFFKQNPDYQLIIKPHPGELILEGCSKGIAEYIRETHGNLPDNIYTLKSDTVLKLSDLFESRDDIVCITFNGTIGIESAVLGIPVLTVAKVHYKEAGIVKAISSQQEYFSLLKDSKELFDFARDHIDLAKKYAYFYFFKTMVRIPFYSDGQWSIMDWKKIKDINNVLAEDGNIIKICNRIINKGDVLWPL